MNTSGDALGAMETPYIGMHHRREPRENQCTSVLVKHIKAPVHLVWSLVRRFDQPQKYKPFVSRCEVRGDFAIGSVREVNVKSGLPATTSTERLELLDDEEHILGIRIVGGDHRLRTANQHAIYPVKPDKCNVSPSQGSANRGFAPMGCGLYNLFALKGQTLDLLGAYHKDQGFTI